MLQVTGWNFTDAVSFVSCPKCGQTPGNVCRMPKGNRKAGTPHVERCLLFSEKFPEIDELSKGGPNVDRKAKIKAFNDQHFRPTDIEAREAIGRLRASVYRNEMDLQIIERYIELLEQQNSDLGWRANDRQGGI